MSHRSSTARVKLPKPAKEEAVRRVLAGEEQKQVATLLGVGQQTVSDWFTNTGDGKGKSPPPDARVKLTTPAKAEIARRLRDADAKRWTQEAVGALLGVTRQAVSEWFTNASNCEGKSPPPDARVKRRYRGRTAASSSGDKRSAF